MGAMEALWSHADNGQGRLIDAQRASDSGRIQTIMRLPVAVADDDDGMGVLCIVLLLAREKPPRLGLDPKHLKHTARSYFSPGSRHIRLFAHGEQITSIRGYRLNQPQVVAEVSEVEIRG